MFALQIYLDHASTGRLDPRVAEAMARAHALRFANPASPHALGRFAARWLEESRVAIAAHLGVDLEARGAPRLIFTSGGTESNNLAVFGMARERSGPTLVSAVEHPSVLRALEAWRSQGNEAALLPVDRRGVLRLDELERRLDSPARLVSVQLGNHETGVRQPLAEIAALCRARGVPLHCDAVQAVGKTPLKMLSLGISALSFTAHKFYGPLGIGGLLLDAGVTLAPQLFGGFQQESLRPGTESPALAIGMRAALDLCASCGETTELSAREPGKFVEIERRLSATRDRLQARLTQAIPEVVVAGEESPRLPHILNVSFPGVNRQALLLALDTHGVSAATGSACASGSSDPSPTLVAMGWPEEQISSALRFSVGLATTEIEVDAAADCILRCHKRLR